MNDSAAILEKDRQSFIGLSDQNLQTRVLALVRKHMDGGRLSGPERDEVAHLLQDATSIITEATPLPRRPGSLTQDEIERIYELSRAKYFRWRQVGQAVAEGPDLPPFDDPKAMVAWYERMRARGTFKHKCPKLLHDLAGRGFPPPGSPPSKATSPRASPLQSAAPSSSSSSSTQREAPERRGFLVEHEKLEEHTAMLREDYLDAYARNDVDNGNLLKQRYFEAYEMLRKSASQKEPIGLAERSLAKVTDIIDDLGTIVPAIVANLISAAHARAIYEDLGLEERGILFDAFGAVLRLHTIKCFDGMKKSRFAPPLNLDLQ